MIYIWIMIIDNYNKNKKNHKKVWKKKQKWYFTKCLKCATVWVSEKSMFISSAGNSENLEGVWNMQGDDSKEGKDSKRLSRAILWFSCDCTLKGSCISWYWDDRTHTCYLFYLSDWCGLSSADGVAYQTVVFWFA